MASVLAAIPEMAAVASSVAESVGSGAGIVSGIGSAINKVADGFSNMSMAVSSTKAQTASQSMPMGALVTKFTGAQGVSGPTKPEKNNVFTPTQSNHPPTDFGSASNFYMGTNEPGPVSAPSFFSYGLSPNPGSSSVNASMDSIFSRPYYVGSTNWTTDLVHGSMLANLLYPSEFTVPGLAPHGVLSYQKLLKCGLSVLIMTNPTPFQQGQLLCCFMPGDPNRQDVSLSALTVLPHTLINLGVSNSGTLHIPFSFWRTAFDTTIPGEIMGHLWIVVYNPLRAGSDDQQVLPVTTWFQFTDPQPSAQTMLHSPFVSSFQADDGDDAEVRHRFVVQPVRRRRAPDFPAEPPARRRRLDPVPPPPPLALDRFNVPNYNAVNLFDEHNSDGYISDCSEFDDDVCPFDSEFFDSETEDAEDFALDIGLGAPGDPVVPFHPLNDNMPALALVPGERYLFNGELYPVPFSSPNPHFDDPYFTDAIVYAYPMGPNLPDFHQADNQARQVTDMAPSTVINVPTLAFTDEEQSSEVSATGAVPFASWSYHLSTHSYASTHEWSTTHTPGTVIMARNVYPNMYDALDYSAQGWSSFPQPTTLSAVASMYAFWRGTIDLLIQPICTRMHRGRLVMYYLPGNFAAPAVGSVVDPSLYASSYTWSYDIGLQSMFPVSVPYLSTTDWTNFIQYNGIFVILVQTQLAARSGTPTTIDVNIWVRAGDDFEVSVPTDANLNSLGTLYSGLEGPAMFSPVNTYQSDHSTIGGDEVTIPFTQQMDSYIPLAPTRHTGQPDGINSLLTRWNVLWDSEVDAGETFTLQLPSAPNLFQWLAQPATTHLNRASTTSVLRFAPQFFAYFSGGVNMRVVTNNPQNNSATVKVILSPGGCWAQGTWSVSPEDSATGVLFVNLCNQPTFGFQIPYYSQFPAVPTHPESTIYKAAPSPGVAIIFSNNGSSVVKFSVYVQLDRDASFMFPIPPTPRFPVPNVKTSVSNGNYNSTVYPPPAAAGVQHFQSDKGVDHYQVLDLKVPQEVVDASVTIVAAADAVASTSTGVSASVSGAAASVGRASAALERAANEAREGLLNAKFIETIRDAVTSVKNFFADDTSSAGLGICLVKILLYGAQALTVEGKMQGGLLAAQFALDCACHVPKMKAYAGVIQNLFSKPDPNQVVCEHQSLSDMVPSMAWDMVTSVYNLSGDKHHFLDSCKNIAVVANAARGIGYFFERFLACVKACIEYFTGRKSRASFWISNSELLAKWVSNCGKLKQHTMPAIRNTPALREQLDRCYELSCLYRRATVTHPHPPPPLIPTCNMIDDMMRSVTHGTASGRRAEPLVVYLAGEPGAGKSILMGTLVKKLAEHMGVDPDKASWSRNACSKYYDGYFQQPIVLIDDVGASTETDCFNDFMNMVSSAQFLPNMAALPEKGIYFTSRLIICSSNIPYPQPNSIACPKALLRRLHIAINVKPSDNYSQKLDDVVNKLDYYKAEQDGVLDTGECWNLTRYNPLTKRNECTMTVDELVDVVKAEYDLRYPTDHQAGKSYGCTLCSNSYASMEELSNHQNTKHRAEFVEMTNTAREILQRTDDLMDVWKRDLDSGVELDASEMTISRRILEYYDNIFSDRLIRGMAAITMVASLLMTIYFAWEIYSANKVMKEKLEEEIEELEEESAGIQSDASKKKVTDPAKSKQLQSTVAQLDNLVNSLKEADHQGAYNVSGKKKGKKVATMQASTLDFGPFHKNMVRVHVLGDGQNNVYGLGLVDNMCLVPKHAIMTAFANPTIEITYPGGRVHKFQLDEAQYVAKDPEEGATASDLLVIAVPCAPQQWASIVHRLYVGAIHHVGFPGALMTPGHTPALLTVASVRASTFAVQEEQVEYVKGFTYTGLCRKGMCGAPLLSLVDKHQNRPVLGIHTAGDGASRGNSEAISHDWIVQTIRSLAEPGEHQSLNSAVTVLATGISPPLYQPTKTVFKESPLSGIFPDEREPAVLHPRDHRVLIQTDLDSMYTAKFKVTCEKEPPNFKLAVNHYTRELQKAFGITKTERYGLKEAVCGNKACLNALNLKTSPGYPWCKLGITKKDLIQVEGLDDWDSASFTVSHEVVKDMERIAKGGSTIWCSAFKDELRPMQKVCLAKTRTIDTPPVSYTLLFRKEFGHFCDLFVQNNGVGIHHAIGCDPDKNFTQFWRELVSCSNSGFACDFSGFDGSVPSWALKGALFVMSLGDVTPLGTTLFDSIINTRHHFRDKLVLSSGGVPSGTPATSTINSIIHVCLAMTAWLDLNPVVEDLMEMEKQVSFITYGDDGVFASNKHWFTPEAMQTWYQAIGMTFTPAVKTDEFCGLIPLRDCSFLKRHCRWEGGLAHPAIEMATIHSLFSWQREDTDIQEYVSEAFSFLFHHGRKVYKEYADIVQSAIVMRGIQATVPEFNYFVRQFAALHERDIT
uniref:Genome polyprotein n=1 Tax=Guangxi chinese leopard gecko picornavirus TaxID=2116185 RepID=A0A2P1GN67_9VIRU|nr:polyprotein [Guangxi chinese leopard gecko picornavirus]